MYWLPIDKLNEYRAYPTFFKEKLKNIKFTGFKEEWHDELFYGILYEECIKRKEYK